MQPVRASVIGAGAPARVRPPQAIINRQVVATQRPTPAKQPFEQRQAAINMRTERPNQPRPLNNQGNPNQGNLNQGGRPPRVHRSLLDLRKLDKPRFRECRDRMPGRSVR